MMKKVVAIMMVGVLLINTGLGQAVGTGFLEKGETVTQVEKTSPETEFGEIDFIEVGTQPDPETTTEDESQVGDDPETSTGGQVLEPTDPETSTGGQAVEISTGSETINPETSSGGQTYPSKSELENKMAYAIANKLGFNRETDSEQLAKKTGIEEYYGTAAQNDQIKEYLLANYEDIVKGNFQLYTETSTGDQIIETSTGDQIIETSTGDQTIETSTGDQIIEASTGDQIIEANTGDQIIEANTGDQIIEINTGDQIIETNTGDQIIETNTGDQRTTTDQSSTLLSELQAMVDSETMHTFRTPRLSADDYVTILYSTDTNFLEESTVTGMGLNYPFFLKIAFQITGPSSDPKITIKLPQLPSNVNMTLGNVTLPEGITYTVDWTADELTFDLDDLDNIDDGQLNGVAIGSVIIELRYPRGYTPDDYSYGYQAFFNETGNLQALSSNITTITTNCDTDYNLIIAGIGSGGTLGSTQEGYIKTYHIKFSRSRIPSPIIDDTYKHYNAQYLYSGYIDVTFPSNMEIVDTTIGNAGVYGTVDNSTNTVRFTFNPGDLYSDLYNFNTGTPKRISVRILGGAGTESDIVGYYEGYLAKQDYVSKTGIYKQPIVENINIPAFSLLTRYGDPVYESWTHTKTILNQTQAGTTRIYNNGTTILKDIVTEIDIPADYIGATSLQYSYLQNISTDNIQVEYKTNLNTGYTLATNPSMIDTSAGSRRTFPSLGLQSGEYLTKLRVSVDTMTQGEYFWIRYVGKGMPTNLSGGTNLNGEMVTMVANFITGQTLSGSTYIPLLVSDIHTSSVPFDTNQIQNSRLMGHLVGDSVSETVGTTNTYRLGVRAEYGTSIPFRRIINPIFHIVVPQGLVLDTSTVYFREGSTSGPLITNWTEQTQRVLPDGSTLYSWIRTGAIGSTGYFETNEQEYVYMFYNISIPTTAKPDTKTIKTYIDSSTQNNSLYGSWSDFKYHTDTYDIDQDGSTTDSLIGVHHTFQVQAGDRFAIYNEGQGEFDNGIWKTYLSGSSSSISLTPQGGIFQDRVEISNSTINDYGHSVVYNILPRIGDSNGSQRNAYIDSVPASANTVVKYSTSNDPVLPEFEVGTVNDWTTTMPADKTTITAIKYEIQENGLSNTSKMLYANIQGNTNVIANQIAYGEIKLAVYQDGKTITGLPVDVAILQEGSTKVAYKTVKAPILKGTVFSGTQIFTGDLEIQVLDGTTLIATGTTNGVGIYEFSSGLVYNKSYTINVIKKGEVDTYYRIQIPTNSTTTKTIPLDLETQYENSETQNIIVTYKFGLTVTTPITGDGYGSKTQAFTGTAKEGNTIKILQGTTELCTTGVVGGARICDVDLLTGTFTYEIQEIDEVNFVGDSKLVTITYDNIPPTCTVEYNPNDRTNQDVVATLTGCNEEVTIINNNGLSGYTFTGDGIFTYEYEDFVGNTGNTTATVTWIDKVPPICTISYDERNVTKGDVIATLTNCSEEVTITNNNGKEEHRFSRNGTFTYEYEDHVGNTGSTTATVTWISGGGGGSKLTKDDCPDGDYSDSYYDGICGSHNITGPEDGNNETEKPETSTDLEDYVELTPEILSVCNYAKELGVQTECLEILKRDNYLDRIELAELSVLFSSKELNRGLVNQQAGCQNFNDIGSLGAKDKAFAMSSCNMGIMGLESDGKTPQTSFRPYDLVTRAEFGTVLSRLLRNNKNNPAEGQEWYEGHLNALQQSGIMTQINNPYQTEIYSYAVLMLYRVTQ